MIVLGLALALTGAVGATFWLQRPTSEEALLQRAEALAQTGNYREAIATATQIPVGSEPYGPAQQQLQQWQQILAQQKQALARQQRQREAAERARQQQQLLTQIATQLARITYDAYSPSEFAPYQISRKAADLTLKASKPGRYGQTPSSDDLRLITLALAKELSALVPSTLRRELQQIHFELWNRYRVSMPAKLLGSQDGLAILRSLQINSFQARRTQVLRNGPESVP
ncbi:hypothetical protein [Leptolyngbya sp. FACHB-261]|uniref:hypothetical protein n=1 Tax=Leptolyngbya sp. FACHB-261 TaxID=2692806 RepID=UPI001688CDA9|nr:hypothetical protein [Leptolyngbya sp. FACHB-261]MBD2104269.1 hypothetical protein [Leptolyngbya sp. FACHB-261]